MVGAEPCGCRGVPCYWHISVRRYRWNLSENGPYYSSIRGEAIVCPCILIPAAFLAVELLEERGIAYVELIRADTDNGPWT